jgi:hypothetical protein
MAGAKFKPAEPEVQQRITGFWDFKTKPRPKNPAERSSEME